ncbi:MAG: hypothetical protein AB8F94_30145 [Saprospiraceae bacterium]
MKNIILVCLSILFGSTLHAQDLIMESANASEKQVGVNITDFFLTFLSFNNPPDNSTPSILVLYKKTKNGKRKRYGFGGRVSWDQQSDGDKFFSTRVNFNFGREFVKKIGSKWKTYAGYETRLSGSYFHAIESLSNDEEEKDFNRSASIGWQGLVGLEYHINNRLSLLAETSYGVSFNYFLSKSENSNPKRRESYSAGTFYLAPTSLILSYHF